MSDNQDNPTTPTDIWFDPTLQEWYQLSDNLNRWVGQEAEYLLTAVDSISFEKKEKILFEMTLETLSDPVFNMLWNAITKWEVDDSGSYITGYYGKHLKVVISTEILNRSEE